MRLDAIETLFRNTWRRYQERFAALTAIFCVPLIAMFVGGLLSAQQMPLSQVLGGLFNLLGVVLSIAASVAMISAVDKATDFSESYQVGFKLFWASIWIAILVSLAIFGGFIMLIIPGIMLAIQLAFATYVLVLEDKRGIEALAESREYIKGYWWAFFGRGILFFLIVVAAMLLICVPLTLLFGSVVGGIVYALLFLVLSPFGTCYIYEIYDNFRRLKPDAAEEAAKAERSFLKVSMVLGVVGWIGFIALIIVASLK